MNLGKCEVCKEKKAKALINKKEVCIFCFEIIKNPKILERPYYVSEKVWKKILKNRKCRIQEDV